MNVNTNRWNKIRYTAAAPGYDKIVGVLKGSRKSSIDSLNIKAGEKILIIGAGTGLDLEFLPGNCEITATDITSAMVERIKKRNTRLNKDLKAIVMDGQDLRFADNEFDKIILHLILAVIPDPVKCIKEAERVLKDGGQIAVFDKFVKKNAKVSFLRKALNLITNFIATDITRDFESIVNKTKLNIVSDKDANLNGMFRLIILEK